MCYCLYLSLPVSPICCLNLTGESAGMSKVVLLGMAPGNAQMGSIWRNIILLDVFTGLWVYSLHEQKQQFKNCHEHGP